MITRRDCNQHRRYKCYSSCHGKTFPGCNFPIQETLHHYLTRNVPVIVEAWPAARSPNAQTYSHCFRVTLNASCVWDNPIVWHCPSTSAYGPPSATAHSWLKNEEAYVPTTAIFTMNEKSKVPVHSIALYLFAVRTLLALLRSTSRESTKGVKKQIVRHDHGTDRSSGCHVPLSSESQFPQNTSHIRFCHPKVIQKHTQIVPISTAQGLEFAHWTREDPKRQWEPEPLMRHPVERKAKRIRNAIAEPTTSWISDPTMASSVHTQSAIATGLLSVFLVHTHGSQILSVVTPSLAARIWRNSSSAVQQNPRILYPVYAPCCKSASNYRGSRYARTSATVRWCRWWNLRSVGDEVVRGRDVSVCVTYSRSHIGSKNFEINPCSSLSSGILTNLSFLWSNSPSTSFPTSSPDWVVTLTSANTVITCCDYRGSEKLIF